MATAMQSILSAEQKTESARQVNEFNRTLNGGRQTGRSLGKDDFIKLLVTQLSYQDPTAPMEDKEFIAQMAQFSSLEQMTNMAGDFAKLTGMLQGTEASSALGRRVDIVDGEQAVSGKVTSVTRGRIPEVMVNGKNYPWEQVSRIYEE